MPSISKAQQSWAANALIRRRAGRPAPGDPKMSTRDLRDFASTKTQGLPERVKQGGYGKAFS